MNLKLEARGGIEPPIKVLQTLSTFLFACVYAAISTCCTHFVPNVVYPGYS